MLKEIRRFKAFADDGTKYTIIEYARTREHTTQWGKETVTGKLKILRTTEGYDVTPIAEGVYEVFITSSESVTVRTKNDTSGNSAQ